MAYYNLTDLLTPVSQSDMLNQLLSIAASLGLPTTSWQAGQPLRTILNVVAQKLSDYSNTVVAITAGGFGDLASDAWVGLWAQSIYNVNRVQAAPATGLVNTLNSSASQYDHAIGAFIVSNPATGQTYRNVAAISILANVGLANIAVQADQVGTVSNCVPAACTNVVTSDPGVTVTNPLALLGADQETSAALVTRCRAKLGALSPNGPRDAYNYVATTPSLAAVLTPVTRTKTVADATTGLISVYLATATGAPVAGDVAIVQTAINTYAQPWCITATAIAATPLTIPITYRVWIKGSQLTSAQIQTAISGALSTWFATLAIGGYVIAPDTGDVYVAALQQVIGSATPGIQKVSITLPAADVVMTSAQVAVLGTLTPTVTVL